MKIYHYHPDTGVYLGQATADPSPLEPDVWLIPAYATSIAPPKAGAEQQAVMTDKGWQVQPIPEPEPEPTPEPAAEYEPLTPLQRLERLGLTAEDLRAILSSEEASS